MGEVTRGLAARLSPIGGLHGITAEAPVKRIGTVLLPALIAAGVAAATATNTLPLALAASALLILALIGLRSPVFVLALVAALVPVEDMLTLPGAGTATRFVGIIFAVTYVVNRRQLPRLSTMPAAGWAFALWAVASGLWVVDFAAWANAIVTLLQLFALALLVGDLVSRDLPAGRKVMWAYSASAVVTVLAFVAVPYLSGVTADRWAAFQEQDPLQFALVLVPAVLFLIYEATQTLLRRDPNTVAAWLIFAGAGLVGWGVIETGARGAVIGLAVGVAAMTVTGTGRRRGRLLVVAVGLLMAGAALLTPGVAGPILQRFSTIVADSGSGRLDIWSVGTTIFAQHPLFGVGYAGFPAAFTPEVVRIAAVAGVGYDSVLSTRGPHSILVGTAAELGVIGIALLGLFLWRVLSARSGLDLWGFVRAALVATLVQAMLLDVLERKALWLVLGIALGIAAAARNPDAGAVAASVPPDTSPTSTDSTGGHSERPAAHGV